MSPGQHSKHTSTDYVTYVLPPIKRLCIEAPLRRAVRSGLYSADDPSFSQLVGDMDDNLFAKIQHNPHHVLYKLLPEKTDHSYNLRPRSHSFTLSVKTDSRNYINRMLFKDIY